VLKPALFLSLLLCLPQRLSDYDCSARHGASTMRRFRDAASGGRPPVLEIADGSAIILAAGLLLMPGFVTGCHRAGAVRSGVEDCAGHHPWPPCFQPDEQEYHGLSQEFQCNTAT